LHPVSRGTTESGKRAEKGTKTAAKSRKGKRKMPEIKQALHGAREVGKRKKEQARSRTRVSRQRIEPWSAAQGGTPMKGGGGKKGYASLSGKELMAEDSGKVKRRER